MGRSSTVVAVLAFGLSAVWSAAQEAPQPSQEGKLLGPRDIGCYGGTLLRVHVTITRLLDGKKKASLPYAFVVPARPSPTCPITHARMRMGVDTPVPVVLFEGSDPKKAATRSVQYKTVGTNIDCSEAEDLGDGRFKLSLTIENSSALPGGKAGDSDALSEAPLFRRFEIGLTPILRDGQKTELVASTDPITGELVQVEATLNVVK